MANYYCLMAGAPDLSLHVPESEATLTSFWEEAEPELTQHDRDLLFYFWLRRDCLNLLRKLRGEELLQVGGNFTDEQFTDMLKSAREMNFNVHRYPAFMSMFVREWDAKNGQEGWFADDVLMGNFYEYALQVKNRFIHDWYQWNLDVKNVLTALVVRHLGWNVNKFVVGDNEVTDSLKMAHTKDFDLPFINDDFKEVLKFDQESDPVKKEMWADSLLWNWLDDHVTDIFSVEAVFAYLCKLEMLERWEELDPEKGKARFREIIENLRGEAKVPAEFIHKNVYKKNK